MGINPNNGDSISQAIQRGDDVYRLTGDIDDVRFPALFELPSGVAGIMVGGMSDLDLFSVSWPTPVVSTLELNSAQLAPWAPITFRLPPPNGQPTRLIIQGGRPIDTTALLGAPADPAPFVDIWFALKPHVTRATRRVPKFAQDNIGVPAGESLIAFIYCYGRKTLFVNVANPGAAAIGVRVVGRSLNIAGGSGPKDTDLTPGVVAVAAASSFVFNRPFDDSFDVLLLFLTGPSAPPGVFYRMEVRDEG